MKLLFVRHGDPDYEKDSLTPVGFREADALSEYLVSKFPSIDAFYCSILGRAKATLAPTLKAFRQEATYCEWLREFCSPKAIHEPDAPLRGCAWDLLPTTLNKYPSLFDANKWMDTPIYKGSGAYEEYQRVTKEFDKLLASYGYVRNGNIYDVRDGNHKTLLFCCHLGIMTALISHLFNVSPVATWEYMVPLPSSLSVFVSEERREGKALFRMNGFGSVAHLEKKNMEPSFSARFCECYSDKTRHD